MSLRIEPIPSHETMFLLPMLLDADEDEGRIRAALEASVEKAAGSATILPRARSGAASPGSSGFRCGDALRRPGSEAARR